MSAVDVHPAHSSRQAGHPSIDCPEKTALSKHQPLRAAWLYQAGCTPRGWHGRPLGHFYSNWRTRLGEHREGGDQPASTRNRRPGPPEPEPAHPLSEAVCTHPGAAGTALSSHGLSRGSWLSWTGLPAPAELATKPENKLMSLFLKETYHT